jgi:uncharacterized protein (DUF2336 family)
MSAETALELDSTPVRQLADRIKQGDAARRARILDRLSRSFAAGATGFRAEHVAVFDALLSEIAPTVPSAVRADLSERLAPLGNVPPALLAAMIRDPDIRVAGPLLRQSDVIPDGDLIAVAETFGQPHLLALSSRRLVAPPVTDVLVRRGDREVARVLAGNRGSQFSQPGISGLVDRAGDDGMLAVLIAQRHDVPPPVLKRLVERASEPVRRRMLENSEAAQQARLVQILAQTASIAKPAAPASGVHAKPTEATVRDAVAARSLPVLIETLAAMSGVRVAIIAHLLNGERNDPILVLGKSLGFSWATVEAMIRCASGFDDRVDAAEIETARINFERLMPATAQRVLTFWSASPR